MGTMDNAYFLPDLFAPKWLLTHPLGKMAGIFADDNFKCIFFYGNDKIPVRISLKFVPRSPIGNEPALVQVMAWRRAGLPSSL